MCDLWQLCHPSSWFVPENSWKSKPSSIFFSSFPLCTYIYISTLTKNLGGQRCLEKLKFWENLTDSCQKKCNMHCAAEFNPFIFLLEKQIPPCNLAVCCCTQSHTFIKNTSCLLNDIGISSFLVIKNLIKKKWPSNHDSTLQRLSYIIHGVLPVISFATAIGKLTHLCRRQISKTGKGKNNN